MRRVNYRVREHGGVGTLPTPILETPASGRRAGVRPRVTDSGGGKVGNQDDDKESEEEDAASITKACVIGDEVAADNDVWTEAAIDTTSGGAGALPTPVLETPASDQRADVRPRVTNSGGGKAKN